MKRHPRASGGRPRTGLRTTRPLAARTHPPGERGVEVLHLRLDGVELVVISEPITDAQPLPELTAAEHEVCQELLLGRSNEAIAQSRGTSVRTVANQVAAIFSKLGVSSRAELAVFCLDPSRRGS